MAVPHRVPASTVRATGGIRAMKFMVVCQDTTPIDMQPLTLTSDSYDEYRNSVKATPNMALPIDDRQLHSKIKAAHTYYLLCEWHGHPGSMRFRCSRVRCART